jgi:class 3 adenylate cyclase
MGFEAVLEQTIALLQRQGRISYGALKRRFQLDEAYLEDLKVELIEAQRLAHDENGRVLVWAGETASQPPARNDQVAQVALPHVERRTLDAERRQLTVMFCDLVDSTLLASQLDPEDWRKVVRAYQETAAAVIQRFDGHIAQYLGDGLLVYFGYPQAHEDDARRAVRTGLDVVEALGALSVHLAQHYSVQLAVRIGIHTGVVVIGEMGGDSRQEQLALGDTPNVAARIQGLAMPNTVVISPATFRLVRGFFLYQELGTHVLKGLIAPVQVYRIQGDSAAQSRLDVMGATGLTPLVGRDSEVTLLLERWAQSQDGVGQVVLLRGEAGIGKSRLVEVLREQVISEARHALCFAVPPIIKIVPCIQ